MFLCLLVHLHGNFARPKATNTPPAELDQLSVPSLFIPGTLIFILSCPPSFNSWTPTLSIFHPACADWLFRLGRD